MRQCCGEESGLAMGAIRKQFMNSPAHQTIGRRQPIDQLDARAERSLAGGLECDLGELLKLSVMTRNKPHDRLPW